MLWLASFAGSLDRWRRRRGGIFGVSVPMVDAAGGGRAIRTPGCFRPGSGAATSQIPACTPSVGETPKRGLEKDPRPLCGSQGSTPNDRCDLCGVATASSALCDMCGLVFEAGFGNRRPLAVVHLPGSVN